MIGVILSAGMGRRLMPLTKDIPKPLLEINKMTLLERMIKNCISAGVNDFIVIVGYNKDKVIDFTPHLEDKYDINIALFENKEYDVTNTSVSTYIASKNIEDDFILINGDNVVDPEIIKKIAQSENTSMVIDNYKKLNEESFKIIIEDGVIKEIGKELDIDKSYGEFIGVSKVVKKDISKFNELLCELISENRQNYYDLTYKPLSNLTKIDFVLTDGLKWTEIDDHDDFKQANILIKEFE